MEITKSILDELSAEDLENIIIYKGLLSEAKTDVSAIISAYKFRIGEDEVVIWNDSNNAEYLTHSGVWKARYLHQTYNVKVDVDAVFNIYKEEYIARTSNSISRNITAESARYFRVFARRAKDTLNSTK